jgi:hypothetical protein
LKWFEVAIAKLLLRPLQPQPNNYKQLYDVLPALLNSPPTPSSNFEMGWAKKLFAQNQGRSYGAATTCITQKMVEICHFDDAAAAAAPSISKSPIQRYRIDILLALRGRRGYWSKAQRNETFTQIISWLQ